MADIKNEDRSMMTDEDPLLDFYSSFGEDFPERDTTHVLYIYGCPTLIAVGTIGNLLSALLLYRMYQRVLSSCFYVFVTAFIDVLVLYVRAGNDWLMQLNGHDVQRLAMFSSNSMCKMVPFLSSSAQHLGVWLVVALAVETTLVTLDRERMLRACVVERARAVVLLIIVLLVCINAHCFWTFALQTEQKGGQPEGTICTNARQGHINETFRKIVWPVIDLIVSNVFPFFTIFACTVIIITRRCRGKDFTRGEQNVWKSYKHDAVAAKNFQTTILFLNIFYLVLMLPKFACDIFSFLVDPNALALVKWSFKLDVKIALAQAVCSLMYYSCLALKFLVYLTAAKFRLELKALVLCKRCRRRRPLRDEKPLMHNQPPNRCPLSNKSSPVPHNVNSPFAITSV